MDTKELGNLGETLACEYLVKKGFNILGKNDRISFGEIDIIARKKWRLFSRSPRPIHFVEVKTLLTSTENYAPEDRVDYKKQKKLAQLSQIWLQKHQFEQRYPHQIDIIGILIHPKTQKATINYFENVVGEFT
jgi:putative endonuclease